MEDRFAYGLNPKKLGAVSAYLCDPASAPAEFLLTIIKHTITNLFFIFKA